MFSPEAVEAELPERGYRDQTHPPKSDPDSAASTAVVTFGRFLFEGGFEVWRLFWVFFCFRINSIWSGRRLCPGVFRGPQEETLSRTVPRGSPS